MLEECGIPYNVEYVNIGAGEQFTRDFPRISPNNRWRNVIGAKSAGLQHLSN